MTDAAKKKEMDEYLARKYGAQTDQLDSEVKSEDEMKRQKAWALATDAVQGHAAGANKAIDTLLYAFTGDKQAPSAAARAGSAMDRFRQNQDKQTDIKRYIAKLKGDKETELAELEKAQKKIEVAANKNKQDQDNWQKTHDQNERKIAATNENTKARLAQSQADKQEKKEVAQAKEIDKQTVKAQKDLAPLQSIGNALAEVEKYVGFKLDDFDPKTNTVNGKEVDLPGVSIPGLGRITAYSDDAVGLEGKIAKIFNTELKDRSGAAVTTPEMERLKVEFNSGKFNTEEQMLAALQSYKHMAFQAMRNKEAGYSPEAIAEYQDRGGQVSGTTFSQDIPSHNKYLGGGQAVAAPTPSFKPISEMTDEELKAELGED